MKQMVATAKNIGNLGETLPDLSKEENAFLSTAPGEKPQMLIEMVSNALEAYLNEEELSISGWWRLYRRLMNSIGREKAESGEFEPRFPVAAIPSKVLEAHFGEKGAVRLPTDAVGNQISKDDLINRLTKILGTDQPEQMPLALISIGGDEKKLIDAYRSLFKGTRGFDENARVRQTTAKSKLLDAIAYAAHGTADLEVDEDVKRVAASRARPSRKKK